MGYASADQALAAVFAADRIDVPEWGGLVEIRAIPIGSERITAYVHAPVTELVPAGGNTNRKRRVPVGPPSAVEQSRRQIVMTVHLGVYHPETGDRLFTLEQAEQLREGPTWPAAVRVAADIIELTDGAQLDTNDDDDDDDDEALTAGKSSVPDPT